MVKNIGHRTLNKLIFLAKSRYLLQALFTYWIREAEDTLRDAEQMLLRTLDARQECYKELVESSAEEAAESIDGEQIYQNNQIFLLTNKAEHQILHG